MEVHDKLNAKFGKHSPVLKPLLLQFPTSTLLLEIYANKGLEGLAGISFSLSHDYQFQNNKNTVYSAKLTGGLCQITMQVILGPSAHYACMHFSFFPVIANIIEIISFPRFAQGREFT